MHFYKLARMRKAIVKMIYKLEENAETAEKVVKNKTEI